MLRTSILAAVPLAATLSLAAAEAALASPGPPPPDYIVEAARQLVPTQTAATFDRYADELAKDVTVSSDGTLIASGKAAWLALERHRLGKIDRRVLGYVDGYDSILVIDQFDDRSDVPDNPHAIFDPRYKTRALQYRFGADHKVHAIRITQTDGIMRSPP